MYANTYYTIPQQIVLVLLSLISGSISMISSSIIIFIIWRDRHEKLKFVYHRIMFTMSIVDCIASAVLAFSFLTVPYGSFWGAIGNRASCEASGFLIVLYGSQALYNFGLAIYFLMIIYYSKGETYLARYIEPYIHIFSLSIPVGFAFWALFADTLNPTYFNGGWCYVYAYPPSCEFKSTIPCTRGIMAQHIRLVMNGFVMVIPFIGILTCMIMITCRVRRVMKASQRYSMRAQQDQKARQTTVQAMLFIGAMLIPNTFIIVAQSITNNELIVRLTFALLVKAIAPLQGLFNLIIYLRPRFLALRQRNENMGSFMSKLWFVVFGERTLSTCDLEGELPPEHSVLPRASEIELNTSLESSEKAPTPT